MVKETHDLTGIVRDSFGDSPALADELLSLVLAGTKCATCWDAATDGPSLVGSLVVIVDSTGVDRALIRILSIVASRFCDVTEEFAFTEGEGDRSLAYWRKAHQEFFERTGKL